MDKQQIELYVITTGTYSDYRVEDVLYGPLGMRGQFKSLKDEFYNSATLAPNLGLSWVRDFMVYLKRVGLMDESLDPDPRMFDPMEYFVPWLCKYKGFNQVEWREINLDDEPVSDVN